MTINLNSFSGGSFIADSAPTTVLIASGTTADIVVTPPAGKVVLLTYLAGTVDLTNLVSVDFGARTVIAAVNLSKGDAFTVQDEFQLGGMSPSSAVIRGNPDEAVTISTNVAFSADALYAYQFGG